ncbi:MAG: penicillin acylase family protein [Pseudomonadota bacterium]
MPFIEAETDGDAAFALGLVHAHLRLGQMAIARKVATGRISEMAGPWTTDIDAALRALDIGRAAPEIYRQMPPGTRAWMDRFVEGINHYADRIAPGAWPHEFDLFGISWEPWRAEDTLTFARLSGIDINWGVWIALLQVEEPALRAGVLARLDALSRGGETTFGDGDPAARFGALKALEQVVGLGDAFGKTGSNSVVLAPDRSASGAPLIANDPHLGFLIPNVWLIAGLRSPSYEIVGMMVPGTPVFGFGRNRDLAWGGTNLRATTSELVDVSGLPPSAFETVEHDVGVRFWFDETWETRRTAYGPVLSGITDLIGTDASFAVQWIGHRITDETTALLGAMRARTIDEFHGAMDDFAVPPQTFLVADRSGDIASVIATQVPARPLDDPLRIIASPERSAAHWRALRTSTDLPSVRNPGLGVLASANNRPSADESRPYGGIFPQDERIRRLHEALGEKTLWSAEDLMALQMDTVSVLAREIIGAAADRLRARAIAVPGEAAAIRLMLDWDGDYTVDSLAAPVFEAFAERFVPAVYAALGRAEEGAIFKRLTRARRLVLDDLADLDDAGWATALAAALPPTADVAAKGTRWGDIHKINVGYVLTRVPVIGARYLERQIAVPGAKETIFKTSHDASDDLHVANFGAQARHVSDLADPDANWFVLFGGQDGWIGSPAFTDQIDLWRQGQLVQVPLTREAVARTHRRVMRLTP